MPHARISRPLVAALVGSTLLGAAAAPAAAQSYLFTTLSAPGVRGTFPRGINDAGQVAGSVVLPGVGTQTFAQGFVYAGGDYRFLNVPGASDTFVNAINASGQVVGSSRTMGEDGRVAFLYSGGAYQTLVVPGATFSTDAYGINASGQVVLDVSNATGAGSVLYDRGVYRPIAVPGASATYAGGINDAGQIVGNYTSSTGANLGFLYDGSTYRTLDPFGGYVTFFSGIGSTGAVVGSYYDGFTNHGFVYQNGTYQTVDVPGADYTIVNGINGAGQIVGYSGALTGQSAGFVGTPVAIGAVPEPGTLALVAGGAVGLVGITRRRGGRRSTRRG